MVTDRSHTDSVKAVILREVQLISDTRQALLRKLRSECGVAVHTVYAKLHSRAERVLRALGQLLFACLCMHKLKP